MRWQAFHCGNLRKTGLETITWKSTAASYWRCIALHRAARVKKDRP